MRALLQVSATNTFLVERIGKRSSGERRPWKEVTPPELAGVYSIIELQITPDGKSYFYSYTRLLSQLYLVRGLK